MEWFKKTYEGVGDLLGSALQGLASWIGLDSQIGDWLETSSYARKLHELEVMLNEKISRQELDLSQLQAQLDKLQLAGMNLTGRALNFLHDARQTAEDNYNQARKNNAITSVKDTEMMGKLNEAQSKVRKLGITPQHEARDIASEVENYIGGKNNNG